MSTHIHLCSFAYIHPSMHTYMSAYIHPYIQILVCLHKYILVYNQACLPTYTCIHTYIYSCAHINNHACPLHMYIDTYTFIDSCMFAYIDIYRFLPADYIHAYVYI